MAGTKGKTMRRDLEKRINELEGRTGGGEARERVTLTPEMRAAICTNADDTAAYDRLAAGDKSALCDLSTEALEIMRASRT